MDLVSIFYFIIANSFLFCVASVFLYVAIKIGRVLVKVATKPLHKSKRSFPYNT